MEASAGWGGGGLHCFVTYPTIPKCVPPDAALTPDVSKISTRLVSESKRFKWGAKKLNALDAWKRWAPLIIAAIIVAAVMFWYLR